MIKLTFSKVGQDDIVLTEDDLFDFEWERGCFSGETFELGGVCAKSISMIIDNNTQRFGRGTFANTRIKLEIDGMFCGLYNAELPKRRNGIIELTAYDDMLKLDVEYPSTYDFPQVFASVYAQCVLEAGLVDSFSLDSVVLNALFNNGVISHEYTDYIYANSCRNLVSGMAEWNGGFAHINDDNKLQVDVFSKAVSKTFYSGDLMALDYSDETITFSKIKTSQKNKTYEKGDDSGYTLVINNQYISYGLSDEAFEIYLGFIYDYYKGFTLTPMTFTLAEPDFDLRIGDRISVVDEEENVTVTGNISKIVVTGNCLMEVTCGGFGNVAGVNNYKSSSSGQTSQVKGNIAASAYVSLPVTNPAAINYDAIERGLLSVDFTVSGTDSAVVFAGAQQCNAASAGTVDIAYKVDGATQDHKPSQALMAGRHILPHYLAMALSKGKHNFAVYITSADGRGSTPINGLAAALSGQISGIKINTPPNDNLLLYFSGVPAGTTITLPQLYSGSGADKTVDWGDGSAAETSACNATVEHTYADGGDFVVTIKSTETRFMGSSAVAWKEYLTAVYFPDNATYISWSFLGNCPNLGTVYLGKSATSISLTLTNCAKLTSLIFPDTAVSIGVTLTGTSVTDITIPAVATTARTFSSLTSLQSIAFDGALLCSCQSDTSLKTVRMTDKINAIPDTCFSNCTSLADIDLPKTITKIGANAFSRCAKLPSLPLLPELTSIGVRAFEGCSGLSDAAFGDKLASMGIYAFHNCVSLSSVDIPSSLVTLPEGAFQACTGLTSVSHGGLMTIGAKAFEGCTQLAGFEFPSGLIVGSQAFAKTGFENVDVLSFMPLLTSGTTAYGGKYNIGAQAFANCTKLSEVSGYKYKFSVGLRVTESTKEDGVWTTTETDMGEMADARGIYNAMGATSDSVFSGTALKTAADYLKLHPEYSNESTNDYKRTYTAYDIKSTD